MNQRNSTCCVTGSRPEKISFQNDSLLIDALKRDIQQAIETAYIQGYSEFITGMCRGFDLGAAQQVLELRKKYPIRLICAIPFENQDADWTEDWKQIHRTILYQAEIGRASCRERVSSPV